MASRELTATITVDTQTLEQLQEIAEAAKKLEDLIANFTPVAKTTIGK